MQEITPHILRAMRDYMRDHDLKRYEFAARIGVGSTSMSNYLNGEVKELRPDTWSALEPLIRPYLPQGPDTPANMNEAQGAGEDYVPSLNDSERLFLGIWRDASDRARKRALRELLDHPMVGHPIHETTAA